MPCKAGDPVNRSRDRAAATLAITSATASKAAASRAAAIEAWEVEAGRVTTREAAAPPGEEAEDPEAEACSRVQCEGRIFLNRGSWMTRSRQSSSIRNAT